MQQAEEVKIVAENKTSAKVAPSQKKLYKTGSSKAGTKFPVGRIARFCKKGKYADRIGAGAPVVLAAVLEYLTAEVIEFAANKAKDEKKSRIIPRHLMLAIRSDEELRQLFGGSDFCQAGAIVNVPGAKSNNKKGKKHVDSDSD